GKIHAGRFFEHFAEIKAAGVNRFSRLAQGKVFFLVLANELLGLCDHGWLGVFLLDDDLIAQLRKVGGENLEQFHDGIVFSLGHDARSIPSLAELWFWHLYAPLPGQFRDFLKLRFAWFLPED